MSARNPTPRQKAWRQSQQLKDIGRAALTKWNREQQRAPICGARTKKTGEPCQQPALENGRCRVHGGLTPRGDDWHKPRWPNDGPNAERKLIRKLADLEKRRQKIARRVAAMTPDERKKYDEWHRARAPGSIVARQRNRNERQQSKEFRERMARYEAEGAAKRNGGVK